jgi:hypothetical protein
VSVTRAADKTLPDEVAAITAALQGFIPVLEDVDPRQRAYIYTEDATFAMPWAPLLQGRVEMLRRLLSQRYGSLAPLALRLFRP